jgi:hypothetical protein
MVIPSCQFPAPSRVQDFQVWQAVAFLAGGDAGPSEKCIHV